MFIPSGVLDIFMSRLKISKQKLPMIFLKWYFWYFWNTFENVKNTHGGVLLLVKLQASACNFTKINTLPWVFFMFFKLYKWYQIAQRTTYLQQYVIN